MDPAVRGDWRTTLETRMAKPTQADAEAAVRALIEWAGDDPSREGLIDTLGRVARSYCELFAGYAAEPRDYLKRAFEEVSGYDELVVLRDIRVVSFCEHHMLPVVGRAHVGYLPTSRVVDLQAGAGGARVCPSPADPGETPSRDRRSHPGHSQAAGRGRGDQGRAQLHDVTRCEHARIHADHQPPARRDSR